jgi:hypothetical protein
MSSSRNVNVSLDCEPSDSDHAPPAAPDVTTPWTMNPSGASTRRISRIPRWSMKAPMDRKTSSKSWRGLPS